MLSYLNLPLPYLEGNNAAIRVYDEAGNVIETHEHKANAQQIDGCVRLAIIRLI